MTRSQEANANLGILKQGLGDLEKSIVVSAKEDGSIPSPKSPEAPVQDTAAAVNYQKQLEEHTQVLPPLFYFVAKLTLHESL